MKATQDEEFLFKDETYRIIGACFEVYNDKGNAFTEPVYQECLEIELGFRSIPFEAQPGLPLIYKGRPLKQRFLPDIICFGEIIVELKSVSALSDEHRSQVLNYLAASGRPIGLLVNFGHHPRLEYERLILSPRTSVPSATSVG